MRVSPYTHKRLTEAASSSRTLSEALTKLGVDPNSPTRRYVRDRMTKAGVDTSHFEREGARWTSDVLEPVVAASTSMCEVLRRLGLEVVGGHHTHISRRVKTLGIDTSHFTPPSRAGESRSRRTPQALLVEQAPGSARRIPSERLRPAMTALGVAERCALCGTEPFWRGRPCRWRWIMSMATGGTTVRRTCAFSAPIATRQRTLIAAGARRVGPRLHTARRADDEPDAPVHKGPSDRGGRAVRRHRRSDRLSGHPAVRKPTTTPTQALRRLRHRHLTLSTTPARSSRRQGTAERRRTEAGSRPVDFHSGCPARPGAPGQHQSPQALPSVDRGVRNRHIALPRAGPPAGQAQPGGQAAGRSAGEAPARPSHEDRTVASGSARDRRSRKMRRMRDRP